MTYSNIKQDIFKHIINFCAHLKVSFAQKYKRL